MSPRVAPVASRFAMVRMLRSWRSRTSSLTLPSSRYRRKIDRTSSASSSTTAILPGDYPERWSWEIRRKSKPLGVKLTADGFQSDFAAQFAGKRALEDFLCELSKEEKHQRK